MLKKQDLYLPKKPEKFPKEERCWCWHSQSAKSISDRFQHLHYCAGFVCDELLEMKMHLGECNYIKHGNSSSYWLSLELGFVVNREPFETVNLRLTVCGHISIFHLLFYCL